MAVTKSQNTSVHAGLLRRFFAFFVDTILLGVLGIVLSIPFSQVFYTLGYHGWWIGFIITLLYFSLLQSKLSGQTFGAKLLKIAVLDKKGKPLSLKNALIRNFMLLLVPYNSAYGQYIPAEENLFVAIIGGIIFFSYLAAFLVFLLFHPQRRGLHDLITGAYVVHLKKYSKLTKPAKLKYFTSKVSIQRPVKAAKFVTVLVILGVLALAQINFAKNAFINEKALAEEISTSKEVKGVSVVLNHFYYDGKTTKTLYIAMTVDRETFLNDDKLNKLYKLSMLQAKSKYPTLTEVDQVQIRFNSGYSIGIWTLNENLTTRPVAVASL